MQFPEEGEGRKRLTPRSMPTAADVPAASSQAVSCWSLTRSSPCTSPMIPRAVARITRRELGRRTLLRAARHAHTRGRARERERRQRGGERRERGRRTRAAATAASAWRCGDQGGGCTGCLDDHRVMSVGAWRPAAAADDDPEAAFPAGGTRGR